MNSKDYNQLKDEIVDSETLGARVANCKCCYVVDRVALNELLAENERLRTRHVSRGAFDLLVVERDRLRAALDAVRELTQRGTGTDLAPTMLDGVTTNAMWVYEYLQRLDASWRDRLRSILNAADGGDRDE